MDLEDRPSVWERLKLDRPDVIGAIENALDDFGMVGVMMLARAVAIVEILPHYVAQTYGEDDFPASWQITSELSAFGVTQALLNE